MGKQSLKEKTANGLFWGGLSNGVQQLISLVFGIFLARILTADDYGMVGMLTIFSLIASTIQESGFTAALTNKQNIKHEDYNAVFWFSTFSGIALYIALFFCAPLIADFYNTPAITSLARFLFLGFAISATGIAHNAILFRNLRVKEKTKTDIAAVLVSGSIGVTMALSGMSYWGIATQQIVYVFVVTVLRWHFSAWRPTFQIDFRPLKSMLSFSSKLLLTHIIAQINANIFSVLLGKYYSKKDVGFYTQGNKWMMMGHLLIASTINTIAQPVFSQVVNDKQRQVQVFQKLFCFIAFVSFPAMLGLAFISEEFILIAIGDKWLPSVPILQLLCIVGAIWPFTNLYSQVIISKGKSNIYFWINLCFGISQILIALLTLRYGVLWLIRIYVLEYMVLLFVWQCVIKKQIGFKHQTMIKELSVYLFSTLLAFVITYGITLSIHNLYLLLISKISIAAIIYIGIMKIGRSVVLDECIAFVRSKLKHDSGGL
ncbi:Teichuronic acid biosynthesis protein TuaB [termite gut metagenome]|uniref:Teichuronic acid biosynthesis protein TuaB n=1 Tax=termite gut metagenome TaxID=433724 RepID=A0A5J4QT51_9ZZZZ